MIPIIYGTQTKEKFVGYGAGFCPFCRGVRSVRIDALVQKSHLYYINYKDASDVWHQQLCCECGGGSRVDISNYKALVDRLPDSLKELISLTYPSIESDYREQLDIESQVKRDPLALDEQTRASLMKRPFSILAFPIDETIRGGAVIDFKAVLVFVLGAALSAGLFITAFKVGDLQLQDMTLKAAFVASMVSVVIVVYFLYTGGRRVVGKLFVPLIVRALVPLMPKDEELDKVLDFYKVTRGNIGKRWFRKMLKKKLRQASEEVKGERGSSKVNKGDYVQALKDLNK